jgi:hypothetical protein
MSDEEQTEAEKALDDLYSHLDAYGAGKRTAYVIERLIDAKVREERKRLYAVIEEVRTSPQWSGQHADWICDAIKAWAEDPN